MDDFEGQALLCQVCKFPVATVRVLRFAHRLAEDLTRVSRMVRPEHAQKAALIAQGARDEVLQLLKDLPGDEDFTPG